MSEQEGQLVSGSPGECESLVLAPCTELKTVKGLALPADVKFRQIILTGPPGAGKSHLIRKLGGWPEEGYIDLTQKNWWRAHPLTLRPRELNFGFPFVDCPQALSVFDDEWMGAAEPLRLDPSRLQFPPRRAHFLAVNWRVRYAYFFLIPPAQSILAARLSRAGEGVHMVDADVTLGQVERQVEVYREVAMLFHRASLTTFVVDGFGVDPKRFVPSAPDDPGGGERVAP